MVAAVWSPAAVAAAVAIPADLVNSGDIHRADVLYSPHGRPRSPEFCAIAGPGAGRGVAALALAPCAALSFCTAVAYARTRRQVVRRQLLALRARVEGEDGLSESTRRVALASVAVAALGVGTDAALRASDERYALSGTILPPAPFKETSRTELIPGQIWGFEQVIAFATVSANIRMAVVRLRDGTLWVSGPIAPTRQCLRLLDEIGEVAHLVVAGTALEHKASLAEFHRAYPRASVWVSPGQNATLLDVQLGPRIDGVLGQGQRAPPWQEEIDFKVFYVAPPETAGTYAEVAFFHRPTRTLLATDAVLKVPTSAPPILASYGYDGTPGELTSEQWQYKFLAFNFLTMRGSNAADLERLAQPPAVVSPLLRFTLYPICQSAAAAWVMEIAKWPFEQVVAGHLQSPFPLKPSEFLEAFGFLFGNKSSWEPDPVQLADLRTLSERLDGPLALESSIWRQQRSEA